MVSNNYPENLLLDHFQTWNVHLFDEPLELINIWDALVQFWLSVAKK